MAKYRITAPDGNTYEVTAPDDATQEQVLSYAQANYKAPAKPSTMDGIKQGAGNLAAGMVRGAGSIGATLLAPIDIAADAIAGKGLTLEGNRQRRADMDSALGNMGAETDSLMYGAGKLAGEIAGTAGAGGAIANVAGRAVPAIAGSPMLQAIASGGMRAGGMTGVAGQVTRAAGGAVAGGVSAGLANPEDAAMGALVGGVAPAAIQGFVAAGDAAGRAARSGANRLMQSAIKPTIAQLKSGDAETAVQTLLERGISPNQKGVNRLRGMIDEVDDRLGAAIVGSNATIDPGRVMNRLADPRATFGNQVSPTADMATIQAIADDFAAHPSIVNGTIPVQQAQDLKRGTYKVLSKKYDKMGTAEVEAQKALARGLKEEIATAVPGVQGMNDELSRLITTLDVAERRALMELNKNPMGLAALAGSPASWAAFMADRSATFKALAARMLNAVGNQSSNAAGRASLPGTASNRLLTGAVRAAPILATQD